MKKINIYLCLLITIISSCSLEDNINPKAPAEITAATIFSTAEVAFVDQYNSMSVNKNISRLLCQHWGQITYTSESRYDFQDRSVPDNYWLEFYRDILMDLRECKLILDAPTTLDPKEVANKKACAEILEIFSYATLVETFGDVPYSESLLGNSFNTTPKFDDGLTIYKDLFTRIDTTLASISTKHKGFPEADIMFKGDMKKWIKFANSLKVRMAMRMVDVDAEIAKKHFLSAYENAFVSGEVAALEYIGADPYVNTIYDGFIIDGRRDYVPSNTLIDYLKDLSDPRLPLLFKPQTETGKFIGIEYGLTKSLKYDDYSNFTDKFFDSKLEAIIIDGTEMDFFKAEAIERGFIAGNPEQYYNAAIAASIKYWGGTNDDVDAYLANPKVAYATAGEWKEKIGMQKWIALYNQGVEAWTEWRRLDAPKFNVPEKLKYSDIPKRYPYPFAENKRNGENYAAAAAAIGGDKATTALFWDKH